MEFDVFAGGGVKKFTAYHGRLTNFRFFTAISDHTVVLI